MPTDDRQQESEELVYSLRRTRQERAEAFTHYLNELIIDWQYQHREWITTATKVAKMIGVSNVTAGNWLSGTTLPKREHCVRVAMAFQRPLGEVLEAAGYNGTQDDSYNTLAALLSAVENDTTWPDAKRQQVLAALLEALSPPFATQADAAEWRELVSVVLQQKATELSKAERLAGLIELWHRQQQLGTEQ